jgi:hypothetical protein
MEVVGLASARFGRIEQSASLGAKSRTRTQPGSHPSDAKRSARSHTPPGSPPIRPKLRGTGSEKESSHEDSADGTTRSVVGHLRSEETGWLKLANRHSSCVDGSERPFDALNPPSSPSKARQSKRTKLSQSLASNSTRGRALSKLPHQCTECQKGYCHIEDLHRHRRRHHGESRKTPRRKRESQIRTTEDAMDEARSSLVSSHPSTSRATQVKQEQLASPPPHSLDDAQSAVMSSTPCKSRLQTDQLAGPAEMFMTTSRLGQSPKRKRDDPVKSSLTPPLQSETYASPLHSITPASAPKSELSQTKTPVSLSPVATSMDTLTRKRKRDPPQSKDGTVSIRPSSRSRSTCNTLSPISPEVESQPGLHMELTRERSSSLSSDRTIEDANQPPHEDVNRQLWPVTENDKISRSVGGHLSEQEDFELPTSLPGTSPEQSAPILSPPLSTLEETTKKPAPTVSLSFSSITRSPQPSKRVVSHGEEVVLGSDDDDSEDSDLPEITFTTKPKIPSVLKSKAEESEPKKKYAFSLDALIEQEKEAAAADARIEAARTWLQLNGNDQIHQTGHIAIHESVMACLVENVDQDEGNARRVRDAFSRTEALDLHEVWHFFDEESSTLLKHAFPIVKPTNNTLASILNDPARRYQALVTGFLTRLAAHTPLPKNLILWMMEEVCREPKEVLVQSYLNFLEASLAQYDRIISPTQIESLFEQMGAYKTMLSPGVLATPSKEPVGSQKRPISARVYSLVALLDRVAKYMSADSRKRATHLLVLASFDDSVTQDGYLCVRIEASINTLLKAIPEDHFEQEILEIGKALFTTVKSPVLRHQLISALPCYTSQTHHFRRQLALAFALNSAKHLESSLDNHKVIHHILLSLRESKHYQIGKKTDYTVMGAYFSMLDVAIDVGFSDFIFADAPVADSAIGGAEDRAEGSRKLLFAPQTVRRAPENPREKAFNEDVDKLTQEIRDIMAQILDSGASHMKRTECKATADRLIQRLENGVRTKAKPAKDWYDRNDHGKTLMEGFVKKEVKEEPVNAVMDAVASEVQQVV